MYLIRWQDSIYQSGTSHAFMSAIMLSSSPFPFRTLSMILKERSFSTPIRIRYVIISSRVQIAVDRVQYPCEIKYSALSCHTLVPWDRPEIRTRSEKLFGFVCSSMFITKWVPSSGSPRLPSLQPPMSSGLMPSARGDSNRDNTSWSSIRIAAASTSVRSSSIRIMVGSWCPKISSFNRFESILW